MTDIAVSAHNLHKSFPVPDAISVEVLHGISCSIEQGRMTSMVGPSGSGKSTALLCLAGLESATSGQVTLMGRNLNALSPAKIAKLYRDKVGFVFQSYNLVPYLSVRENIAISDTLAGRRSDQRRLEEVLSRLRLESRANSLTSTLSGGEQQRVALGRILYRRPAIVFADEPTGALDTRSASVVLYELRRLADEGATVVLVTHDLNAASLADSVMILRDGHIISRLDSGISSEILLSIMNNAVEGE